MKKLFVFTLKAITIVSLVSFLTSCLPEYVPQAEKVESNTTTSIQK